MVLKMLNGYITKSLIALLSALSGAGIIFLIKLDHRKLCGLISFSAGALLGAAAFVLLPESAEGIGIIDLILAMTSGYLLFWFISKYFAHVCPACSASHFDEQTTKKFSEIVLTLLTALSIHSLLDGMALSSGVSVHNGNDSIVVAVITHKFPEGLALAALMFSSNYTKIKIFISVTLVELTTVLGAVAGYYLFHSAISTLLISAVMAHIAGGFIYLAFHAVLGEMYKHHKGLVISSFIGGAGLILFIHLLIG